MTELQQYIWSILGVATVFVIKWLIAKIFSKFEKSKEESRKKMENTVNEISLRQKALAGALSNMDTIPELEVFSKQFKKRYIAIIEQLRENPAYEDIL